MIDDDEFHYNFYQIPLPLKLEESGQRERQSLLWKLITGLLCKEYFHLLIGFLANPVIMATFPPSVFA